MDSISLDGVSYKMNEIVRMELVRANDSEPPVFEIAVTFANGSTQILAMTMENVAGMNAWLGHVSTYVPKLARGLKGPK